MHSFLCSLSARVLPLLLILTATLHAQETEDVADPPLISIAREGAPRPTVMLKAVQGAVPVAPGEAVFDLNVVYTKGRLWNPAELRYDDVNLRSYQGRGVNPNTPYVSPTIEVFPGETIRMTLNNRLPADPTCTSWTGDMNTPHCFNGTNLHTHGLWVNPAGNGDNVLISINPGVSFQYEYKLPPDHPAGTFWYHTHRHGSTALQVSSGMAGALVVRGTRLPSSTANGDIDTLLGALDRKSYRERLLVMQQIQYACRDAEGKIKLNADGSYKCDAGDVGGIEGYDQFGPGSWPKSGRYTSINGRVLPVFGGAAGRIERWRMIHGGVRDTINLSFRRMKDGAAVPTARLSANANDSFIGANCTGNPLTQHLIAADGLTLGKAMKSDETVFQPAYRWDALMVFPEPGVYCVIDDAAPAPANVDQTAPSRQLLGFVVVGRGENVTGDVTPWLIRKLVGAAAAMPADVRAKVVADLEDGLSLSSFVPHPDIKDDEVTGTQQLTFNIDVNATPTRFEVNGQPYDAGRIDRTLMLGGVDEWTLQSDFVSHPFHIHINPFQIVKILDPDGKDVSGPDAVDGGDTQYRGLKGVWKDTLWVKNSSSPPGKPGFKYTIVVRTRYQRYIGDFVLHCHILDHEDQGMMQNVRIALPDGAGGMTHGHH